MSARPEKSFIYFKSFILPKNTENQKFKAEQFNFKVGVMFLKWFFTEKTENLKVKVEPFNITLALALQEGDYGPIEGTRAGVLLQLSVRALNTYFNFKMKWPENQ